MEEISVPVKKRTVHFNAFVRWLSRIAFDFFFHLWGIPTPKTHHKESIGTTYCDTHT